jgi:hypothetical protein
MVAGPVVSQVDHKTEGINRISTVGDGPRIATAQRSLRTTKINKKLKDTDCYPIISFFR